MPIEIFALTCLALFIIVSPLLAINKIRWVVIVFVVIVSIIVAVNGTYSECQDGWNSPSIGEPGACSWHGGVVQRLNDFGESVLIIDLIIVGGLFIYGSLKDGKDEFLQYLQQRKQEKRNRGNKQKEESEESTVQSMDWGKILKNIGIFVIAVIGTIIIKKVDITRDEIFYWGVIGILIVGVIKFTFFSHEK